MVLATSTVLAGFSSLRLSIDLKTC